MVSGACVVFRNNTAHAILNFDMSNPIAWVMQTALPEDSCDTLSATVAVETIRNHHTILLVHRPRLPT